MKALLPTGRPFHYHHRLLCADQQFSTPNQITAIYRISVNSQNLTANAIPLECGALDRVGHRGNTDSHED